MVDLGTGDGRWVLAAAAADPNALVIGVDANADAMAEASRRAAGPARRGGVSNALFVVASAEALPPELDGVADLVTIHLPWGSLLRGALALDEAVASRDRRPRRTGRPGRRSSSRRRPGTAWPLRWTSSGRLSNGLADDWRRFGLRAARGPAGDRRGHRGGAHDLGQAPRPARRRPGPRGLPAHPRASSAGSALISSRHVRRPRPVRRHGAADPDRRRRPQPARHPRRAAPAGRLRGPDRARRRRGAPPPVAGLARPPDHRHADAADGRPDARARGQGPRRPADHRPVGDRHRRLQGRPARRGRRGLRHQALPLPGAAGPDHARPAAARRPRPAPAPGPRARTWRSSSTGARRSSAATPSRSRRPSRGCCTRSRPTSARP